MKRREMREHIFKLLFMGEFNTIEEMPEKEENESLLEEQTE